MVDFLTYVLVPVVAMWRSDLMPSTVAFWIGLVVVIASALYFADTRMKTNDYWFRGFPAIWNVFAFYLFVMRWPWPINAALTLAATAAMFAPVVFVHPLRVRRLRPLTIAATVVWFALAAVAIVEGLQPQVWVKIGLAALAVYFLLLPLARPTDLAAPLSRGGDLVLPARGETCYSPPRCGARGSAAAWPRGGVATQRTANPCTPVRFRARPPLPSFGAPPATARCRNQGGATRMALTALDRGRRGAAAEDGQRPAARL